MADDFDSSAPFDETAFYKTLPSDIEDAVSLKLLNEIAETNEMFHGPSARSPQPAHTRQRGTLATKDMPTARNAYRMQ